MLLRALLLPLLVVVVACSANPVRTLPPVAADPAALQCARQALDAAGYDVRVSPRDSNRLEAERREGASTTEVRRELITVALVTGPGGPQLQASAQAVAHSPAFSQARPNQALPQGAVVTAPLEQTVVDAQPVEWGGLCVHVEAMCRWHQRHRVG